VEISWFRPQKNFLSRKHIVVERPVSGEKGVKQLSNDKNVSTMLLWRKLRKKGSSGEADENICTFLAWDQSPVATQERSERERVGSN